VIRSVRDAVQLAQFLRLGTAEGKAPEYAARGQAVADLCRLAGADEKAIPAWIEEGKRRRRPGVGGLV